MATSSTGDLPKVNDVSASQEQQLDSTLTEESQQHNQQNELNKEIPIESDEEDEDSSDEEFIREIFYPSSPSKMTPSKSPRYSGRSTPSRNSYASPKRSTPKRSGKNVTSSPTRAKQNKDNNSLRENDKASSGSQLEEDKNTKTKSSGNENNEEDNSRNKHEEWENASPKRKEFWKRQDDAWNNSLANKSQEPTPRGFVDPEKNPAAMETRKTGVHIAKPEVELPSPHKTPDDYEDKNPPQFSDHWEKLYSASYNHASFKKREPQEEVRYETRIQLSELSDILANCRAERIIGMIVGPKKKVNRIRFETILRRFSISHDLYEDIARLTGIGGNSENQENESEQEPPAEYSTRRIKDLIYNAVVGAGDSLAHKMHPFVIAAISNMQIVVLAPRKKQEDQPNEAQEAQEEQQEETNESSQQQETPEEDHIENESPIETPTDDFLKTTDDIPQIEVSDDPPEEEDENEKKNEDSDFGETILIMN